MKTQLLLLALAAGAAFGQYKTEPAGAPPSEAASLSSILEAKGTKVVNASGAAVCEVWFRTGAPAGPKASETDAVAFPAIPHGALLGVIRFPAPGADRRGQTIKPGVYTLRYSLYPVNGDHQGVAPQRDFLVLTPAAADTDANALPDYEHLMDMSRKASGTPHPAVLSIEAPQSGAQIPGLAKEGEKDWVLNTKVAGQNMGVILIGKYEG